MQSEADTKQTHDGAIVIVTCANSVSHPPIIYSRVSFGGSQKVTIPALHEIKIFRFVFLPQSARYMIYCICSVE